MADFNPAQALIRNAWELTEQIPQEANWHYHDFVNETLSTEPTAIQDPSITDAGEEPEDLKSKINTNGVINVALNAEAHAHYLARFMEHSATPVNLSGGAYSHKLAPGETDVDFAETLTVEVSRDDGMPQLHKGVDVTGVNLSLAPSGLLTAGFQLISARADYWDAAEQTTGSGGPNPTLRGFLNHDNWTLADPNIYLKCISASGKTFRAKRGNGSSYDATYDMTFANAATWYPMYDEQASPERLGDRSLEVEIYFPNFTSLADNDAWRFDAARAVWVPTYPDVPKFNEIYAVINIDGTAHRLKQVTLNCTKPGEADFNIGERFADQVIKRGRRTYRGSINRRYVSTALRKKLETGTSFTFQLVAYSGVIVGTSAYEHTFKATSMNCKFSGRTPVVGGQSQLDENLNFSCHPSDDGTYPNAMTFELINSIASLAT